MTIPFSSRYELGEFLKEKGWRVPKIFYKLGGKHKKRHGGPPPPKDNEFYLGSHTTLIEKAVKDLGSNEKVEGVYNSGVLVLGSEGRNWMGVSISEPVARLAHKVFGNPLYPFLRSYLRMNPAPLSQDIVFLPQSSEEIPFPTRFPRRLEHPPQIVNANYSVVPAGARLRVQVLRLDGGIYIPDYKTTHLPMPGGPGDMVPVVEDYVVPTYLPPIPRPAPKFRGFDYRNGMECLVAHESLWGASVFPLRGGLCLRIPPPLEIGYYDVQYSSAEPDVIDKLATVLNIIERFHTPKGVDLGLLGLGGYFARGCPSDALTYELSPSLLPVPVVCSCGNVSSPAWKHEGHTVSFGRPTHNFDESKCHPQCSKDCDSPKIEHIGYPVGNLLLKDRDKKAGQPLLKVFFSHLVLSACLGVINATCWLGELEERRGAILVPKYFRSEEEALERAQGPNDEIAPWHYVGQYPNDRSLLNTVFPSPEPMCDLNLGVALLPFLRGQVLSGSNDARPPLRGYVYKFCGLSAYYAQSGSKRVICIEYYDKEAKRRAIIGNTIEFSDHSFVSQFNASKQRLFDYVSKCVKVPLTPFLSQAPSHTQVFEVHNMKTKDARRVTFDGMYDPDIISNW